jgi:two-component system, NtrC family, sensor kinase
MSKTGAAADRILVIGDEGKSARAIGRLLDAADYYTSVIDSFDAARRVLARDRASIIVISLSASRVSGPLAQVTDCDSGESAKRQAWAGLALEFCREIRNSKHTDDLPILVISKSQRVQDKVAVLNAGGTDYLTSPYQKGELLSRVKAHLRSYRHEREITSRFEETNVLQAVSSVLSSSLEPDVLAQGTLSVLTANVKDGAGVVYLFDSSSGLVSIASALDISLGDVERASLLKLYSTVAPSMNGKPLAFATMPAAIRELMSTDALAKYDRMLWAPLGLKGNRIGALCLLGTADSPFPERLSELLATTCNQLSVALENARLYIETKKSASRLSFLYNLGNNLMTSLEMDELLGYAVFTVGKSLECDLCAVVIKGSGETDDLQSAIYARSRTQKPDQTADWCDINRINQYIEGIPGVARITIETRHNDRFLLDRNVVSETIVPLMFDDFILGVLICASYAERLAGDDERRLLVAVAQQLSLAIRNTELFKRSKDTSITLAVEVGHRTREIEEQKRFTEKIIDSLPVSLYVVDRDMRIVAWNRNREVGGGGLSKGQVLGRNVFQVFHKQPRRRIEEEFVDVFRTGDIVNLEQESWIDGSKKFWKISKIPMRVDNAEVTHVITVGEDITEQKKMNDAVIHAEKLASIGRLAAGVVHELNNPLATIAACAEALKARLEQIEAPDVASDFAEYLDIVREEAFRCKTINNSLLDFSHQRQTEKMSGDINQIIDQTLSLIKHHPKLGRMTVVTELDTSLAPVYVNEGQIKQIFIALISNACDAMDHDGTLTIRTRSWPSDKDGDAVCAEIADNGCGIPASHLPKIFDPFFTTKPLGRGTGLGLSVCYGIVSEHGGKIEVDSVEGSGSTFRVLLPVPPKNRMEIVP